MMVMTGVGPHDRCRARTRGGSLCQQPKGWGTDHLGQGRCKLHGGRSRVRHGRYSTILRPSIQVRLFKLTTRERELLIELARLRVTLLDPTLRIDALKAAQHLVPRIGEVIRALLRDAGREKVGEAHA